MVQFVIVEHADVQLVYEECCRNTSIAALICAGRVRNNWFNSSAHHAKNQQLGRELGPK